MKFKEIKDMTHAQSVLGSGEYSKFIRFIFDVTP
jgi:hypothetical protein